jgi:glycosyltransferase involved in cell wall biosynthesis
MEHYEVIMRVIFTGISGYDYPHTRVRCYNFARELAGYGYQTEVLSYRDTLKPVFSEVQMYAIPDRWKLILNLKALRFLLPRRGGIIYLQKIHYHSAVPLLLCRLGLFKLVFDLDDWDAGCLCLFRNPLLNRFFFGGSDYREIVTRTVARSEFCVVASHSLLEILNPLHPRVFLLHTGVDSDRFSPATRSERTEVLCGWTGIVWGDTIYKSVMMMIEAFASVWEENRNIRLKLIGGGQFMPLVRQNIELNYSQVPIEFVDWVHPDKIVEELHRFDIGLLPLLTGGEDSLWIRSKSPTKFFEYLSTGLPTVASAIGEVEHIVHDGINGFLAATPAEFRDKLLRLTRDGSLRREMGRKARETIEKDHNLRSLGKSLALLFDRWQSGWKESGDSPLNEGHQTSSILPRKG